MSNIYRASNVNEWFPLDRQNVYIKTVVRESGLTRKQATCFVRLWGYACLQQADKPSPIENLHRDLKSFPCPLKEAADLFYCDQSRGSKRSAGMRINELVAKNVVSKGEIRDGNETCLKLLIPDSFLEKDPSSHSTQFCPDSFNPQNDSYPVAIFVEESYSWRTQSCEVPAFQISQALLELAAQCPDGLRVLRTIADRTPVGFAALFPTHSESEKNFFQPPSLSMYLCTPDSDDPIKLAIPGDENCRTVFIRSWAIRWGDWSYSTVCQFVCDTQTTLARMREQFPNLCQVFAIGIHPRLEDLALMLGFQPGIRDPETLLRWLYIPLERFLELDVDEVLADFDFRLT